MTDKPTRTQKRLLEYLRDNGPDVRDFHGRQIAAEKTLCSCADHGWIDWHIFGQRFGPTQVERWITPKGLEVLK
jgi:hypothetical protein